MRRCPYKPIALALMTILGASPAQSEVVISAANGTLSITGELLSFENGVYVIDTSIGQLTIPAENTTCTGEECPAVTYAMGETIRLAGSPVLVNSYLFNVLDEYSVDLDASVVTETTPEGLQNFRLLDADDQLILAVEAVPLEPAAAFDALLNVQYDMVLTTRRASNAEIEEFFDRGLGNLTDASAEAIVAQDGLVVAVSPDNPVRSLTLEQLDGIFSGRIDNWAEVGGGDQQIKVVLPAEDSAESQAFYTAVLEPNFSDFASDVQRNGDLSEVERTLLSDTASIGTTSSAALGNAKPLNVTLACGLVAEPGDFTIKSEDYPMTRRHYAYSVPGKRTIHMENLIDLMAVRAEPALGAGLVSLETTTSDLNDAGKRLGHALTDQTQNGELVNLRGFISEVLNAERLSTTFRFGSGSSQLDNKARADAIRLAQLLEEPQYAGRELLLVGFTDSIGRSDVNLLLSQRRAQQVLDELTASGVSIAQDDKIKVLGFGASSPIACNTDNQGRELNRRVEVWLR